jgi:hypothetical protein
MDAGSWLIVPDFLLYSTGDPTCGYKKASLGIAVMESWICWIECAAAHPIQHIQAYPCEIPMSLKKSIISFS